MAYFQARVIHCAVYLHDESVLLKCPWHWHCLLLALLLERGSGCVANLHMPNTHCVPTGGAQRTQVAASSVLDINIFPCLLPRSEGEP